MSQQVNAVTLAQRVGLNVFLLRQTRSPRLSQQELAQKSGLAVNTIANVEANRDLTHDSVAIRTDTIESLARALEVSPVDLFSDPFADDWPTRVFPKGDPQMSDFLLDLTGVA